MRRHSYEKIEWCEVPWHEISFDVAWRDIERIRVKRFIWRTLGDLQKKTFNNVKLQSKSSYVFDTQKITTEDSGGEECIEIERRNMRTKLRSTSNGIIQYEEDLGTFLPEVAGSLSFGLGICAFIEDLPKEYNRVENMKALIQYGIQENKIDVRIRSSQAKEMIEELDRQMSLVLRNNSPNKFDWFSEFNQKDDLLQPCEYEQFPQFTKIIHLKRVEEEFFDFRFHFKATLLVKKWTKDISRNA